MFFGFMTYLVPRTTGALLPIGFWLYLVGGSIFVLSFLAGRYRRLHGFLTARKKPN